MAIEERVKKIKPEDWEQIACDFRQVGKDIEFVIPSIWDLLPEKLIF